MLIFISLYQHRHEIQKLGFELRQHNQRRNTELTLTQFSKSKKARSSFANLSLEMHWLLPKFEKFRHSLWYFGVLLLCFRLMQTSFLTLVPSQLLQAAAMSGITFVTILLQSELAPYRRASDNRVALLAHVLIFSWVRVCLITLLSHARLCANMRDHALYCDDAPLRRYSCFYYGSLGCLRNPSLQRPSACCFAPRPLQCS